MIQKVNPFSSIEKELKQLNINLQKMIGAKNATLNAAAKHLFNAGGKRLRPSLVLIIAKQTHKNETILPEHRRLAEITEIIHTASLVHDDVIDDCETRRGLNTVHNIFNKKVAILAGDFLFAQSSWYLANLNNLSVVKIISKVITDFAEGEIRQGVTNFDTTISINDYIEKSFYKTASLMASSCQGTAMLSKCHNEIINNFYLYGKHLGLAFQIIDDILDITSSSDILGKPSGSDLKNGNLTAPLMFTMIKYTYIINIINEEFQNIEDINIIIYDIKKTKALQKAKDLAQEHIQTAIDIIRNNNINDNNSDLIAISNYMINRLK
uniref:Prenyl transferase n=1 Tax=Ptilothamnion sphaericum TaxID=1498216 RepID=A0A4D6WZ17_9FLOR|nr:Prenyl transferase [Ptilothamnion sphaericum]